jgi:uncharacterized NAD(P)/FAD-binding protein YdhS
VDVGKLITQLRDYLNEVDRAIGALQSLADQRRGLDRPRRSMSPETRKKMALAQKRRWNQSRKRQDPTP